jgi:hypothetical protein
VLKDDYAKWMLEDPKLNFAISTRGGKAGVDHLGIQVESGDELGELAARLKAAGEVTRDQEATTCCYAKSEGVGQRPFGPALGNLPHPWRSRGLRRGRTWRRSRIQVAGGVLRAGQHGQGGDVHGRLLLRAEP